MTSHIKPRTRREVAISEDAYLTGYNHAATNVTEYYERLLAGRQPQPGWFKRTWTSAATFVMDCLAAAAFLWALLLAAFAGKDMFEGFDEDDNG